MFETLREIDGIRLNFSEDGKLLLNLTIAFIMFGVALELRLSDFKKLLEHPRPVLAGILSQFLLMPLATFLFALALRSHITPTVGLGMILVAACPGGNISNFISALARGNVALSVSLTAFSSLAGLVLTPLNFALWGNLFLHFYTNPEGLAALPTLDIDVWDVLATIFLILGIPLLAGISFSSRFPGITGKVVVPIKRLSILAFLAMIVLIFSKNYDYFLRYIGYIFLIVLVHNGLALTTGYSFAALLGLSPQDRKTITIETGIQNSGLALALLFNPRIFPPELQVGGMAFVAAWWGVWHIISGLTLAGVWTGFRLQRSS